MTDIVTATAINAQQEFQEKMKQRMRAAMGDLMPDSVLADIVARGVQEAFFAQRQKPKYNSWDRDEYEPAWIVTFLKAELDKRMQEAVKQWMIDNSEKLKTIVAETLQDGVTAMVLRSFDRHWQNGLETLQSTMFDVINKLRNG